MLVIYNIHLLALKSNKAVRRKNIPGGFLFIQEKEVDPWLKA